MLAVSATGYGVLAWSDSSIKRLDAFAGLTDRPSASADGSSTFLLVGTDGREGMTRADSSLHVGSEATPRVAAPTRCCWSHVSPRHGTVNLVSLPRDSYVTIPAHTGTDGRQVAERRNKLNAAYAFGGPPLAVATVERTTGVRIDHYLEVDFLGFVKLVDAVGGVDVCAPPHCATAWPGSGCRRGHPRRRGDGAGVRARPPRRRPRRPRPDRAPATVPRLDGSPG